jgi:hypothetical protein
VVLVIFFVFINRRKTKEEVIKSSKKICIVVIVLEIFKILFELVNGHTYLDAWFPLAYCSLFIYALIFGVYGKGIFKRMGQTYLSGPSLIAGLSFLIFPTTSLKILPLFHFLSFHSMIYHSLMLYVGIMYFKSNVIEYKIKEGKYYILFLLIFSLLAILINYIYGSNMMFYDNPYNFPFQFIIDIYNFSNILHTVIVFLAYLTLYYVVLLLKYLITKITGGMTYKTTI